jgi:succinate dehydrogenase / fumarate reductase cytochrome b subunit
MTKTKQEIYDKRPISPHLTIYKLQISSTLSITHRITGIGLFFAISILAWWFILLSFSKFDSYYLAFTQYCIIKICLVIVSFAWFYHLCNGIRHLAWDSGYCFSIKAINFTGWCVIACSLLMTALLFLS